MIKLSNKLSKMSGNMSKNAILIRGLNRELYNKIIGKAKEQGKNVGDLMNEVMETYLFNGKGKKAPLDPRRLIVSGSVTLSKSDIIGIHEEVGQFKVENNGDLFFDEDVDREALQCIEKIYNKGKLLVPKNVHPITLIKIGHVQGEVKKY